MLLDLSDQEDQQKLLVVLLALAKRVERGVIKEVRPDFVQTMLVLRQLVEGMSSEGQFRWYEWQELRRQSMLRLMPLQDALTQSLVPRLLKLEPGVQTAAGKYVGVPSPSPRLQSPQQLVERTKVAGASLDELLGVTTPGRYVGRIAQNLDKTVRSGLMRQESTKAIADRVIKVVNRGGVPTPIVNTGSFANATLNQTQNVVNASTWDVVNKSARRIWVEQGVAEWEWNAVLDPKTCPVCFPLDGLVVTALSDLEQQPPVHPNCRCVVVPRSLK